jgi:hypothetical protein
MTIKNSQHEEKVDLRGFFTSRGVVASAPQNSATGENDATRAFSMLLSSAWLCLSLPSGNHAPEALI